MSKNYLECEIQVGAEKHLLESDVPDRRPSVFDPLSEYQLQHKGEELQDLLGVIDTTLKDIGRGITRIDPRVMEYFCLSPGDVIQVINIVDGSKTAVRVGVSVPEDIDTNAIRLDRFVRENIRVSINDRVAIRKIGVVGADTLQLSPVTPFTLPEKEKYYSLLLENRVISQGDCVRFSINGCTIAYRVTQFTPKAEAVVVTPSTRIIVLQVQITEQLDPSKIRPPNLSIREIFLTFFDNLLDAWDKFDEKQKEVQRQRFLNAACDAYRDLLR